MGKQFEFAAHRKSLLLLGEQAMSQEGNEI